MDERTRHLKIYRLLYQLIKWPVKKLFGYTHEEDRLEVPTLVVSNHVTDVDFFFLALGLNGSHMYFVASDHMFRWGFLSKVIHYLVAPIARRKATTAMDTAMTMMRTLRAGYSVCVFGEGESSWNGRSIPIYPATATLARVSGAPLKTFRIEGGHLTMPRWGKGIRRGKVHGHVVNTYTPEQLKAMSPSEINEAINRDLYEDAWERQKQQPVRYRSRKRAETIETLLFMCPECKRIGTIRGKGHQIVCDCGFKRDMTEYGTLEPAAPFENIAQWDDWQNERLLKGETASETIEDTAMTLKVLSDETSIPEEGTLRLEGTALVFENHRFEFDQISNLALIQKRVMVLNVGEQYYEIRGSKPLCLRKYLMLWQEYRRAAEKGA